MKLKKTTQDVGINRYKDYYQKLEGGIDGYYERMLLFGDIYLIYDHEEMGICSYHEERGFTGLFVYDGFLDRYSEIFAYVTEHLDFDKVLFSDKDTRFYNEVNKIGWKVEVQANNFVCNNVIQTDFMMRLVTKEELNEIQNVFGDFFTDYLEKIERNELFTYKDGDYISIGAFEPMILPKTRACVAMKVNEKYLRRGYGTQTVQFLIQYLQQNGVQPNARCWIKNPNSKQTLLKSGFYESNLLLKVEEVV